MAQIGSILLNKKTQLVGVVGEDRVQLIVFTADGPKYLDEEHFAKDTEWVDTGLTVELNKSAHQLAGLTLDEVKIILAGGKLPFFLTKDEFMTWINQTRQMALEFRRFGAWTEGLSQAKAVNDAIKRAAVLYFSFSEDEQEMFSDWLREFWNLGYSL